METNAVVVHEKATPTTLIERAMSMEGMTVESLKSLYELQVEWEKNEARKAYHAAMAEFKKEPLTIIKDKHVKYKSQKGVTDYKHASLGNIVEIVSPALARAGLSASWSTSQDSTSITVTCTLTHAMGHSESVSMSAPFDSSGGKNVIQAIGSANTYLQRYTFLAITGQTTNEIDDDGANAYPEGEPREFNPPRQNEQPEHITIEKLIDGVDYFCSPKKDGSPRTITELNDWLAGKAGFIEALSEEDQAKLHGYLNQVTPIIEQNMAKASGVEL